MTKFYKFDFGTDLVGTEGSECIEVNENTTTEELDQIGEELAKDNFDMYDDGSLEEQDDESGIEYIEWDHYWYTYKEINKSEID